MIGFTGDNYYKFKFQITNLKFIALKLIKKGYIYAALIIIIL
jgi:hypothetical protein